MTTRLTVLSLGGGWQSSALYLMSATGEVPRLDAAIFADTQGEMPETYEYLDYLARHGNGIPIIRATAGNLREDIKAKAGRGHQPTPPVRVKGEDGKVQRINGYTCSYDYKRLVVTREVRRLCGARGAWRNALVDQWIGYTRDEVSRMKPDLECRCGHGKITKVSKQTGVLRGHDHAGVCRQCKCEGYRPWRINRWPLIMDKGMTRADCQRWITDHGYEAPPRSACFFCPNRGNSHWRHLRARRRDLWEQACELDEFLRHGLNHLRGEAFIHASGVPLREADLRSAEEKAEQDHGLVPLFADEDMDCDAGFCFT